MHLFGLPALVGGLGLGQIPLLPGELVLDAVELSLVLGFQLIHFGVPLFAGNLIAAHPEVALRFAGPAIQLEGRIVGEFVALGAVEFVRQVTGQLAQRFGLGRAFREVADEEGVLFGRCGEIAGVQLQPGRVLPGEHRAVGFR